MGAADVVAARVGVGGGSVRGTGEVTGTAGERHSSETLVRSLYCQAISAAPAAHLVQQYAVQKADLKRLWEPPGWCLEPWCW